VNRRSLNACETFEIKRLHAFSRPSKPFVAVGIEIVMGDRDRLIGVYQFRTQAKPTIDDRLEHSRFLVGKIPMVREDKNRIR